MRSWGLPVSTDALPVDVQELLDSLVTPAQADAILASGYVPDPDCACEAKCRWCAALSCETCCDGYMNGDHGAKDGAPSA